MPIRSFEEFLVLRRYYYFSPSSTSNPELDLLAAQFSFHECHFQRWFSPVFCKFVVRNLWSFLYLTYSYSLEIFIITFNEFNSHDLQCVPFVFTLFSLIMYIFPFHQICKFPAFLCFSKYFLSPLLALSLPPQL